MFAYCKVLLYYGTLGWGQVSADPSTIQIVSHKTNVAQNSIFNARCLLVAYNLGRASSNRYKKIRDNIKHLS